MKIGLPIFIIPFAFVYNPALLLLGSWPDIVLGGALAVIGVVTFTAGTVGYLTTNLTYAARAILFAAGIAMLWPDHRIGLAGLVAVVVLLALRRVGARRPASR